MSISPRGTFSRLAARDHAPAVCAISRAPRTVSRKLFDKRELERIEDDRIEAEWNDAFHSRVLRVALERIQPSFQPQTWRAFECVWLENRSAAETADALSLGIDAVYTAKSRVLKRLSEEVEEIAAGFSWLDALESPERWAK